MALIAKGLNGTVELLDDRIRISRTGFFAKAGGYHGETEIPIAAITSVEIRPAGWVAPGSIRFGVPGARPRTLGDRVNRKPEQNTVEFDSQNQSDFQRIATVVESKTSQPAPTPPAGSETGVLHQLERLTELRESGALSESEFEAAKRRILGTP